MYSPAIKQKAFELRKRGYSIKEVQRELGIARGTSFVWLRNVEVSKEGQTRLILRRQIGELHYAQAIARKRQEKRFWKIRIYEDSKKVLKKLTIDPEIERLFCSMLFWAEGGKTLSAGIIFTNSDPKMVALFLHLLRKDFKVKRNKFRLTLHAHEYRDEMEMKAYWSQVTKIPLKQFNRTYIKPHTEKRKRTGYKGCVSVRYHDYKLAHRLDALYNAYANLVIGA